MTKPFLAVFFAFSMGYVGYVFVDGAPLERLDRSCAPFTLWPGRLVVAAIKVDATERAVAADQRFREGFNTCRRWLWNAFYEDAYRDIRERRERGGRS